MGNQILLNLLFMIAATAVNGDFRNYVRKEGKRNSVVMPDINGYTTSNPNTLLPLHQTLSYSPVVSKLVGPHSPQQKPYDLEWSSTYDMQSPSYESPYVPQYNTKVLPRFPSSYYGPHQRPSPVYHQPPRGLNQPHYSPVQPHYTPIPPHYSPVQPPYSPIPIPYTPIQRPQVPYPPRPYNNYRPSKPYFASSLGNNIIIADNDDDDDDDNVFFSNYGSGIKINSLLPYKYSKHSQPLHLPLTLLALPRTADAAVVAPAVAIDVEPWLIEDEVESYNYLGDATIVEDVFDIIMENFNEDNVPYSGKYIGLLYAVQVLADETVCNETELNMYRYLELVSYALISTVKQHKAVYEVMWNSFHDALVNTDEIINVVLFANYTYPACKNDVVECNSMIADLVRNSPKKEQLLTEANTLKHVASFAKFYYENYHDQFVEAAKTRQDFAFLIDSKKEIEDLVRAVKQFRTVLGKSCNAESLPVIPLPIWAKYLPAGTFD